MSTVSSCVFCQVIAGDVPGSVAYEDEQCIVLMDLYPLHAGHALVIPKHHCQYLSELSAPLRQHIFSIASQVIEAQKNLGVNCEAAHLLLNDGAAAKQSVPHVHVHLIPRHRGDGFGILKGLGGRVAGIFAKPGSRKNLNEMAKKLSQQLSTRQ